MIVYNSNNGQITYKFCSKQPINAERIFLSPSLHFMVTVEADQVSIWRLEIVTGSNAYDKYISESCPYYDDENDNGENYYDDYDDDKRQDIPQPMVTLNNGHKCMVTLNNGNIKQWSTCAHITT